MLFDKTHTMIEQLSRINPLSGTSHLPDPLRPDESALPRHLSSAEQIPHIQKLLEVLTYNHLPHTFFSLEKHRSLQSILQTAKEVLSEALPIRCLEATFVGIYLTQGLMDVDRIPLSFKSKVNDSFYKHIVLVVHVKTPKPLFGALGLSRKSTLMYKRLSYTSLYDLVMEYKREYEALGHSLIDIKLGLPISHELCSRHNPCWRFVALKLDTYLRDRTPPIAALLPVPSSLEATATAVASSLIIEIVEEEEEQQQQQRLVPPLVPNVDADNSTGEMVAQMNCTAHSVLNEPFTEEPLWPGERAAEQVTNMFDCGSSDHSNLSLTAIARECEYDRSSSSSDAERQSNNSSAVPPQPPQLQCSTQRREIGDDNAFARFLGKFTAMLPIIVEEYYKVLPTLDNASRSSRLCFLDLDEAERDAGAENQRRVRHINNMLSPLSTEARKAALTRHLKGSKEKRSKSRKRSRSKKCSTTRKLPVSSTEGRGAGPIDSCVRRERSPAREKPIRREQRQQKITGTPSAAVVTAPPVLMMRSSAQRSLHQASMGDAFFTSPTTPDPLSSSNGHSPHAGTAASAAVDARSGLDV